MTAAQILRITKLRLAFGLTFTQAALLSGLVYGEVCE
jgi:hypothetical protein